MVVEGSSYNSGNELPIVIGSETSTKAYFEAKLADLAAQLAKVSAANQIFPPPFDILADEIALNRAAVVEVNTHAIERGQISVVTKNAGHSQSSTPDFSPNTGDANELPWDADSGTFGP